MMKSAIIVIFVVVVACCSTEDHVEEAKREKRDFIVSPAVIAAGAKVTGTAAGIIGGIASRTPLGHATTAGGCEWFGSSPFCNGMCPATYKPIRSYMFAPEGESLTFGGFCITGSKAFCCIANEGDCSWAGLWISSKNGKNWFCRWEEQVFEGLKVLNLGNGRRRVPSNCGTLRCMTGDNLAELRKAQIEGPNCDIVHDLFRFGTKTSATCGMMVVEKHGSQIDTLFKARAA